MWKNGLKTVALVTSISLFSACGFLERSPGDTVEKFYEKAENGETNEAIDLFSDDFVDTFGRGKLRMAISENADNYEGVRITIEDEEINGDTATVIYTIELEDGSERNETTDLIKEDGEWKMIPSK